MSRPVIEVEHLSKKYRLGVVNTTTLRDEVRRWWRRRGSAVEEDEGEFWALRDVSFTVQAGEVVGILGRNGAGKSTLLKILSRITEPTAGRAVLRGRVASLLEVGTGFHDDLTGRENVHLNGAILGMKAAEVSAKFDEIVAFAEVSKFIDTPVKHYSSGMRMRLAFAVAAHLEPELLIVDEVLAVGDDAFQKRCVGKMGEVARAGHTVLVVSHNATAIRNLCSRGIVLEAGRVGICGPVGEALNYYAASALREAGATWQRAAHPNPKPVQFEALGVRVSGQQPRLVLHTDIALACADRDAELLLAIDICDAALTPIMQAMPSAQPFIRTTGARHRLEVEVELPPLVPGIYSVDFWIGRHYTTTLDQVKSAVVFEVTESPSPGRTFPHSNDHGLIVAASRVTHSGPI